MNNQHNFYSLLDKYILGETTAEEKKQLATLLEKEGYIDLLDDHMRLQFEEEASRPRIQYPDKQTLNLLLKRLSDNLVVDPQPSTAVVHRIHFLRTAWFKYAAVILITLGVGAYLWNNARSGKELATTNDKKHLQTDIPPGGDKAILTLSDGTKIILDSTADGQLAEQYGSKVLNKDGQVIYEPSNISTGNVVYNTMSTPRGGQYKLTLPDGTKVWLNAATSITYPIVFVGKERNVKVSGEAYFEVTKNKQQPFIVDIDGKSSVQVLGTEFNINSYGDEGSIKTTLIDGSVKVFKADQSTVLKPGQQAVQAENRIIVNSSADLNKVLAWKNGLFNFDEADLYSVMRQLERWYDIDVQYRDPSASMIFQGKMYRNANLSDVLEMLKKMGVNFQMEGKTLIVLKTSRKVVF